MNKDNRYEIIIEALCRYAENLEQQLAEARTNADKQVKWMPVAIDEAPPEIASALKRHNVTAARGRGRPRKSK
jgi:hypothetical protein